MVSWLALKNSQMGWPVPNADILKGILLLINWRLAPICFQWLPRISAESLPQLVQAARLLATQDLQESLSIKGAYCPLTHGSYPAAKHFPTLSNQHTLIPIKMRKVLANTDNPCARLVPALTPAITLGSNALLPHRNCNKIKERLRYNLQKLVESSKSSGAFWKLFRKLWDDR